MNSAGVFRYSGTDADACFQTRRSFAQFMEASVIYWGGEGLVERNWSAHSVQSRSVLMAPC